MKCIGTAGEMDSSKVFVFKDQLANIPSAGGYHIDNAIRQAGFF